MFFLAFTIVVIIDFVLPFVLKYTDYINYNKNYEKEKSKATLVFNIILTIPVSILYSFYTLIIIYSSRRQRYITRDLLTGRKTDDCLSLLKNIQLVCGYSFALIYCNLYFYKTMDKIGEFGKPKLYEEIIIPD